MINVLDSSSWDEDGTFMRRVHKHPWRFFPTATNPYASFGSKVGFLLALAYTTLYAFAFSISVVSLGQASLARKLLGLSVLFVLPLTLGFVVGVLGSYIIGGLTGMLIGWIFSHVRGRLSPTKAGLIGFVICLSFVLVVHSIIFGVYAADLTNADTQQAYLLYVGVPSCIYLTAGAIGSSVMYRRQTRLLDQARG
jgi:hypothetical protein